MGVRTPPPAKKTQKKKKERRKKKKKRERFLCVCVRNPKPYIVTHAFFFCILKKRLSVTKSFSSRSVFSSVCRPCVPCCCF